MRTMLTRVPTAARRRSATAGVTIGDLSTASAHNRSAHTGGSEARSPSRYRRIDEGAPHVPPSAP